jgi:hypothetical protein
MNGLENRVDDDVFPYNKGFNLKNRLLRYRYSVRQINKFDMKSLIWPPSGVAIAIVMMPARALRGSRVHHFISSNCWANKMSATIFNTIYS